MSETGRRALTTEELKYFWEVAARGTCSHAIAFMENREYIEAQIVQAEKKLRLAKNAVIYERQGLKVWRDRLALFDRQEARAKQDTAAQADQQEASQ